MQLFSRPAAESGGFRSFFSLIFDFSPFFEYIIYISSCLRDFGFGGGASRFAAGGGRYFVLYYQINNKKRLRRGVSWRSG